MEIQNTLKLLSVCFIGVLLIAGCGSSSKDEPDPQITHRWIETETVAANGTTTTINTYNEGGYLQTQDIIVPDNVQESRVYRYSDALRLISREDDFTNDGSIDRISIYDYNEVGVLAVRYIDVGGDDLIEAAEVYTFGNGDLTTGSEFWVFENASPLDALPDYRVTRRYSFTYTGAQLTTIEIDTQPFPQDGAAEIQQDLQYDENGLLLSTLSTDSTNGTFSTATHTFEQGSCNIDYLNSRFNFLCVNSN